MVLALAPTLDLSYSLFAPDKHSHWTPGRTLRRAREVLRDEGLKSLWFKILGETVYRRLLLVERALEDGERHGDPARGHLALLKRGDLSRYALFRPDADLNDIARRLDQGDVCLVMSIRDEITHACWIADRQVRIDYLECEVDLATGTCLAYDVYTKPDFRGRGMPELVHARWSPGSLGPVIGVSCRRSALRIVGRSTSIRPPDIRSWV